MANSARTALSIRQALPGAEVTRMASETVRADANRRDEEELRALIMSTARILSVDIISSTRAVDRIATLLERFPRAPSSVPFEDLASVCQYYFGDPVGGSGSHRVYRTPWAGDPRVNIQNRNGQAKPYQVRQVLAAIARLEQEKGDPR